MISDPSVSSQLDGKPDKEPPPRASPSSFKFSPTTHLVTCSLKRKRPPKIKIPNVLQEIQAKTLKVKDVTPQDDAGFFNGLDVGVFSVKGKKKFMEDAHKIVSCLHGNSNKIAAEFVAENLHNNIFEMLNKAKGNQRKEDAVKAGYLKADEEFLKQGGYVEFHRGAWRVHGILSVSKSIGDAHLKNWVLAEPDTKIFQLTPDMKFLVLASDGLWQEVSSQEAVDIVTRLLVGKRLVDAPAGLC